MSIEIEEFWKFAEKYPQYIPEYEVQTFLEAQIHGDLVDTVNLSKLQNMFSCTYWHSVRSVIGFVAPTLEFARELKTVIGEGIVLEVGAGTGLLAKYLDAVGVNITATDDYSWYDEEKIGTGWKRYFPVEKFDFKEAIQKYRADYLLLCWPMYGNPLAREAAELFTEQNPGGLIIYIGEGMDGCTADDEFHNGIEMVDELENVNLVYPQFIGLHDYVSLVRWVGTNNTESYSKINDNHWRDLAEGNPFEFEKVITSIVDSSLKTTYKRN